MHFLRSNIWLVDQRSQGPVSKGSRGRSSKEGGEEEPSKSDKVICTLNHVVICQGQTVSTTIKAIDGQETYLSYVPEWKGA